MWTDPLTPLRILVRGTALVTLILVGLAPAVLCQARPFASMRIGGRCLDEAMLTWWSRMVCRVFGVRPQARGQPLAGPVLLVANHISWLDIEVLHSQAAMSFVGKAEIRRWPLFGFLARTGGTVFHERGSRDSSSGVAEELVRRLKAGRRVAIFPEGGILPGEDIGRFHARMFRVAIEADCPVQPVMVRYLRDGQRDPELTFIHGENFMTNLMRILGRPGCKADLRFLQPFEPGGAARRDLAERAWMAIRAAYAEPAGRVSEERHA